MTCSSCRELRRENDMLRGLVDELWNDWRRRVSEFHKTGQWSEGDAPPALRLLARDPEDFEEAA